MTTDLRLPRWTVEIAGAEWNAEVAICETFHLGIEDHGLFIADVGFAGAAWGQHLSGRGLDEYDADRKRRLGTAFGCDFIMECVRILGSPEQAKGCRVVVFREHVFGTIDGFAPLADDGTIGEPFFPAVLAARHYPATVA